MGRVNRVRPWVATFSAALALVIAAALSLTAAPASARVAYLTDADAKVVRVIDLAAGEVVSPPIPVGHETDEIVISPDGRTAYAVGLNAAELAVIDTETHAVETIDVGGITRGVAISPDGATVYVTRSNEGEVVPIDAETLEIGDPLFVGAYVGALAVAPDGQTVYVAKYSSSDVIVIDAEEWAVEATIDLPPGAGPSDIAVTPDGETAYVANSFNSSIVPIDTGTNTAGATIWVSDSPYDLAITPDGGTAYIAHWTDPGLVSVFDLGTDSVVKTLTVSYFPTGVAVAPHGRTAYVYSQGQGRFTSIDTATNAPGSVIDLPGSPHEGTGDVAIAANQPPTAELSAPAVAYAGTPVTLDAAASSDDDGTESYAFDFGDGSTAVTGNPTRKQTYAEPGTYEARVTVDDGDGCEPLPGFAELGLASPFTGQAAYCNGPSRVVSEPVAIEVLPLPRLRLSVSLERAQLLGQALQVGATCVAAECVARAFGRIAVRQAGKTRRFALKPHKSALDPDQPTRLSPGIPAAARRAARRALRSGGKVRARVRVAARGPGDQRRAMLRRVRIVG